MEKEIAKTVEAIKDLNESLAELLEALRSLKEEEVIEA